MPSISEIMVAIRVDDAELGKLDAAGQKIDAMGQQGESVGRSMQTVGLGMAAVGAAGTAMFAGAFQSAANFEQSMDFVGAALGGVGTATGITEAQFASLSAQAQELGSTTQYTAGQVASVQEELGKSGVAASSLLSGATESVLSLSAATGEDLVTSAQVAAGAMNTFGLGGEKMGYVADVVTGALNNSSMSLKDFNTGMNYLGPTLAQTGGDFDDAAAAIAYFSKQGMKGADAGVSLNRMVDNLVRPKNKEAAKIFENLGISAFDSTGQLKPIPDMLDNINQALSGLSEQEQLELVSKLFGAESADVVLRALSGAGDGIRQMGEDITVAGIAGEQAAQRMDNFSGDLETMGGAFDSAGQKITSAFLPLGRTVVQFITSVVNGFNSLPAPIQAATGALLAVGSALTGGVGAGLLIVPKIIEGVKAFQTLKTALMATEVATKVAALGFKGLWASLGPVSIILAAISLGVVAYSQNWLGFRDAVNQVADALGPKLQQGAEAAGRLLKALGTALAPLGKAIADSAGKFKDWLGSLKPLQAIFDAVGDALGFLLDRFGEMDTRSQAILILFGPLGAAFLLLEKSAQGIGDALGAAGDAIGNFSGMLQGAFQGASDAVMGALGGLSDWLQSTLGGAFAWVAEKAGALRTALEGMSIPDGLQRAFEWLQTNVGDKIKSIVDRLGDLKDALGQVGIPGPLQALADWFGETLVARIQQGIEKFQEFQRIFSGIATEVETKSAEMQQGTQSWSDAAVEAFNNGGLWLEGLAGIAQGTDGATEATHEYASVQERLVNANKDDLAVTANLAAERIKASSATKMLGEDTGELTEAQTNFIDAMREALPATSAFVTALSSFGPVGQDVLDVMEALADAGATSGIGASMAGFVDGMSEANQELNGVLGTMSQIANLGAGLQSAQDVAQKLVGDPGVYATVDDLLAAGRISLEQYNQAQDDEVKIVQANTAAQEALNVMRLNQIDNLAAASQEYSDYIVGLSHAGEAEQAHALAMMDSGNQAKVNAAFATAYAVSLQEIPATVGTDIIANAAQADPVLKQLLMDFGLVKEGAEGQIIVTFPDASDQALARFTSMFDDAQVREVQGLITVTQSDGSTLVYDQFNNLVEKSGTVIPATVDVKINSLDTALASGAGFGATMNNVGTDIVTSIQKQVESADYTPITTAAETKVSAAVTAVSPENLDMAAVGASIVTKTATSVTDAGPSEITSAINTVGSDAVAAVVIDATKIGADLVTSAATGVTDKAADFSTAVKDMTTQAIDDAEQEAATSDSIGIELVAQAVNGVINDQANFKDAAVTMVNDAINDASQKAAESDKIGIELVSQGTNGITNDQQSFKDAAVTMVNDAITDAVTATADATKVGQEFVTKAAQGITDSAAQLRSAGEEAGRMLGEGAIAGINGMVGAVMTAANNLGAMAAQGIQNGINAGLATISGAAAQIPAAITEPVQSGMLMESPSKLMYQMGLYVDEGLANGIEQGTGMIADAVRAMIAHITGVISERLGDFGDAFDEGGRAAGKRLTEAVNAETADPSDFAVGSDQWYAALHDKVTGTFTDTGSDSGKGFKDAVNDEIGDPSDLKVGSDEWYAALHDNILGHFGETGKQGGKKLKDEFDAETVDILGGLEDVLRDAGEFTDLASDIKRMGGELAKLSLAAGGLEGVVYAWANIDHVLTNSTRSASELGQSLGLMADQLMALGDKTGDQGLLDLGEQFRALSEEALSSGNRVRKGFIDEVMKLGAELPGVLDESGAAFGRFGQMSTDKVIKSMAVMLEEIGGILRNLIMTVREAFGLAAKEGVGAFADACYPGLKDAVAGAGEVIQTGAKDWENSLVTIGEWAGQTVGEAIANGMSQKEADYLNSIGGIVDRAVKKGTEGGKKGNTIGEETVNAAKRGVDRKDAEYQRRMTDLVGKSIDSGKAEAAGADVVGETTTDAMVDGMTSGQRDLITTAGKIATQVVDEFGDRVQQMYDVGKNFALGFARGMEAGASEVQAAANDLGKGAEKELRKATESHSPSQVAKRIGKDVGRGFADGMVSMEDLSKKAARILWRGAWKELKDNVREFGFLGSQWAVEFWEGMLGSPDMTGPLAAWITEQMVKAADTALDKIRAKIAGIAAQLDIARGLVDAPSSIPEVEQPAAVDTTQRDLLQKQLDATRDLADAITKAFEKAFSEAHKAHIDFVQGTISESEYLAKYQAAQDAFNAKNANARQAEALEAQVKAAQAAIDAETAARQKAYEQAVKDRQAAVDAEKAAREQAVRELEQAQRDAQMEMTQAVIDEANKRIGQYQKELSKTNDPQQKAELKAKIALEKERIDVANQLAAAITDANNATNAFDLSKANAQIEFLIAQLNALEQVDVGGMLQGIADAMLEAANKIAQAADKMKHAFGGGGGGKGGGGKNTGEKDKLGGTQDASDPSLSGGGGGMGGVVQEFDKGGKAARKFGDDVNAGMGVADVAIRKVLGTTLPEFVNGMGEAGTKGGKKLGDSYAVAMGDETPRMTKITTHTVESATLNGVKIGHDRGREVVVEWTAGIEGEAAKKERTVTKTFDGVVTESTKVAEKSAKTGGEQTGMQFWQATSKEVDHGSGKVKQAAKGLMDGAGAEAKRDAHRLGKAAGNDLGQGVADGIREKVRDAERAARELTGAADRAGRDKSKSQSPSLVWKAHGHDMADGMIIGLLDRVGDVREAARAVVYTPQGLPGGDGGRGPSGSSAQARNGQAGRGSTIHIENLNLPGVHDGEGLVEYLENLIRTNGVSSGRP